MSDTEFRSGFAAIVGRPNVGKSTLINALVGTKVSIVSDKPNTTRSQVRGIITTASHQVIFVDTPGIHKPRSPLGARLNAAATDAVEDVDVVIAVIDGSAKTGPGDLRVLETSPQNCFVVVNKIDYLSPMRLLKRLAELASFDKEGYFPVSALTGEGVDVLLQATFSKMPLGPMYYPMESTSDTTDTEWIAELVREGLLAILRDELPHAMATVVTEVEARYVRCEIFVERDSQKAIVLGHRGINLKTVGTEVRSHLPEGMYLDLVVKVVKDWQSQSRYLDEFGI